MAKDYLIQPDFMVNHDQKPWLIPVVQAMSHGCSPGKKTPAAADFQMRLADLHAGNRYWWLGGRQVFFGDAPWRSRRVGDRVGG